MPEGFITQQIFGFLDRVKADAALQAQVQVLAMHKESTAQMVALAREHGFSFTEADWEALVRKTVAAGELSDERLAMVTGGTAEQLDPFASLSPDETDSHKKLR